MTDLVSGVLTRISELEQLANDCIAEVGAERAGDEYADGSGRAGRDAFPSYPWGSAERELAFMAGPGHPDAVLRLCRAHRQIVEAYQQQKQIADAYEANPTTRDSDGHLAAAGVVLGLSTAVELIAEGLGVRLPSAARPEAAAPEDAAQGSALVEEDRNGE